MTRSNCWRHLPICLPHPAPAVCTASKLFKILESRFVSVADPPKLSELRARFTIGSNHNPNITRLATLCLMFFTRDETTHVLLTIQIMNQIDISMTINVTLISMLRYDSRHLTEVQTARLASHWRRWVQWPTIVISIWQ